MLKRRWGREGLGRRPQYLFGRKRCFINQHGEQETMDLTEVSVLVRK